MSFEKRTEDKVRIPSYELSLEVMRYFRYKHETYITLREDIKSVDRLRCVMRYCFDQIFKQHISREYYSEFVIPLFVEPKIDTFVKEHSDLLAEVSLLES